MQTFRAYLNGPTGTLVWAAWIEAVDLAAAQVQADSLCDQAVPTVELWSAAAPVAHSADELEAV